MAINRLPPRPPPPPPPPPAPKVAAPKVAARANALATRAQPPVIPSKDSFQPASATKSLASTRLAAKPVAKQATAPASTARSFASVQAKGTVRAQGTARVQGTAQAQGTVRAQGATQAQGTVQAQGTLRAQGTAQAQPAGFLGGLSQGIQNLGQGIQDLAHDTVEGATNVAQGVAQGATNVAQGVAQGATDLFNGAVEGATNVAQGVAQGATDLFNGAVQGAQDLAQGVAQGAQDLAQGVAQGATDLFNGAVQGAQDLAQGVVEGAQDLAEGTAHVVQQGLDALNTGVNGTGNYAPDPATGFGTTPPGTPIPPGARPVQDPQPTGVPGVSIDPDDGWIVGAGPTGPTAYPPNTPADQVQPFTPEGQDPNAPRPTILFTNGILTNSADEARAAQQLANQTGANVVCVHNGTNGGVVDVTQAGGDLVNLPGNAATNTLTNLMTQAAQSGEPVYVAAHSQGGIITSDALLHTKNNLRAQGMSADQVEQVMGNFNVQTFGGAAPVYPSGPNYTHVVHPGDPVSGPLGMGNPLNAASAIAQGQQVIVAPNPAPIYGDPFQNHGFSGYVPQAGLPS
ncbi:hypothetical protein [Melittangium boletus]|uniref:Uncharacterized protein n=1 Tax=Melittangium boletus DSM 14713 TaxID=1294270 RepID=A0A250I957_9BACT|nr:hypothetical protein [Melittangium boletus]ATB27692.1 hypothetical protein MEBOL_001136 [Melittangium boletus DSM 14713]